ncbi:MAG: PhnD/SsuA/transferrin family substrate-binding protein [Pseudomonadota bacterium]
MIVSLGMYDLPGMARSVDDFWSALAAAMGREGIEDVPSRLDRDKPFIDQWLSPDLLFSQTCGYPLTHSLKDRVRLVATPLYDCPDVAGTDYCSLILVREDAAGDSLGHFAACRAVINGWDSQSGFSALRHAIASLKGRPQGEAFFSGVAVSGGHLASMAWVQAGEADLCAVDCVTYHLAARYQPESVFGLKILGRTAPAPSLPYITTLRASDDQVARLQASLARVMANPSLAGLRADMMLLGAEVLPLSAYDRVLEMEDESGRLGYPFLR